MEAKEHPLIAAARRWRSSDYDGLPGDLLAAIEALPPGPLAVVPVADLVAALPWLNAFKVPEIPAPGVAEIAAAIARLCAAVGGEK
jgi:hypothetical protein